MKSELTKAWRFTAVLKWASVVFFVLCWGWAGYTAMEPAGAFVFGAWCAIIITILSQLDAAEVKRRRALVDGGEG